MSVMKFYSKTRKSKKTHIGSVPKDHKTVHVSSGTLVFSPFHPTPIFSKIFRWKIATAIVGTTITQANVFAAWVMATGATSVRSIMANMRIKRLTAICTGLSANVEDEIYIRDANAQGLVDPIDSTSSGQGNTIATWKPNSKSLASDWFNFNTGGSLVIMSLPSGTTLEAEFDFVIGGAAGTISSAVYTVAGASAGFLYQMGLDASPGSIFYTAIGMNQI